jgi:uncharacterized protein (TIGR03083 family)
MVASSSAPTLPERRGVADLPPAELGTLVLAAWDSFLELVTDPATDLTRPSRLPGWTGADTCVHLGSWEDSQVLDGLLASARAGGTGRTPHPDHENEALVAAHRDDGPDEVVAALVRARARLAGFFASPDASELGRAPSRSAVGPVPVLSLVHAGCYELAVHALDLRPCGAPAPSALLLQRGLAALIDITGALAARSGVELLLTASTPDGGWRFDSGPRGWTTAPVPAGRFAGTGVTGAAEDLLDASAGRANLAHLLVARRLHVQHLTSWMRLAPLLEDVPGLPGGAALRGAVSGLSGVGVGVGRVLSHLPGRRR